MTRLRTAAALTTALLLPLVACAPPDEVADDADWPAQVLTIDPGAPALPLPPVAEELGMGIVVNDLPETGHGPASFRSEHSVNGAYAVSTLFVGAWGDALRTGDGDELRALSTDRCSVCRRIAASVEAAPLETDLLVLTRLWPFDYLAPTEDGADPVMVLGVEHSAARPPVDAGGETELVGQWRRLLRVAVTYADGTWSVQDVTPEPWDGTMPPRP